jgi:hypothetical protein
VSPKHESKALPLLQTAQSARELSWFMHVATSPVSSYVSSGLSGAKIYLTLFTLDFFRYVLASLLLRFLGAFANLQKATFIFVMPVRPSVCMEQIDFHWKDFHEILYFNFIKI